MPRSVRIAWAIFMDKMVGYSLEGCAAPFENTIPFARAAHRADCRSRDPPVALISTRHEQRNAASCERRTQQGRARKMSEVVRFVAT
jgi:hypothetical protein